MGLQTATNEQTGERAVLVDGEWKPVEQSATDAQGRKALLVGGKWLTDFESTPGGAAVGNPTAERQPPLPDTPREGGGSRLTKIGGAGAIGGVLGYAAPEILTGLGAAASAFPPIAPVGSAMIATGNLLKGARVASAAAGAVGGLAGETAGQVAEMSGANPVTAEVARFVGGAIGPETLNVGRWAIKKVLQAPALSTQTKLTKEVAKQILSKLEGRPQDLSDQEKQYLDKLIADLRGGEKSSQPAEAVYGAMQTGAAEARSTASANARAVLDDAESMAQRQLDEAMRGPVQNLRQARERLQAIGQNAATTAQAERLKIAPERELSDIGGDLRGMIVKRNEAALNQRRAQYAADEAARDAVVQQREGAGQTVTQLPEYAAMVNSLNAELAPGRRSPDVQRNIQHILSQIEDPATSFQALDDVRRKLGDVFKGKAAEGYEAISEAQARALYGKISDIQKKFAGAPQEKLLSQYADATEGLSMFGSRFGKKATALDKYDESLYSTDAARLPKDFFRSREGVQALRELTGDPAIVTQKAQEYAVRELAGKSEAQVRSWMTANRELLAAEPDVLRSVMKYADTLRRGERVATNAERGIGRIKQREDATILNVQSEAGANVRNAERTANDIQKSGDRTAAMLEGRGPFFKEENVRKLIESADSSQWEVAAEAIKRDPQAVASFSNAVRQTIAQRAERSYNGLQDFFNQNVRPAVTQTGLMSAREADEITRQIAAIENMKIPEPEKLNLARRLILNGVGGYTASAASRATVNAADAVRKYVPD